MIKEFEVIAEFANMQTEERISFLDNAYVDKQVNQEFDVPLSEDQKEDLKNKEYEAYNEIIRLRGEIKDLNVEKKTYTQTHEECHKILKAGFTSQRGNLYIIEDNENPNMLIKVTNQGVIIDRIKKKGIQRSLKFGDAS